MQNEEEAKILSAENKPYDFDGNTGVSHTIRLAINDEIFLVKTTEAQVAEFMPLVGKRGTVVVEFISPKEILKMKILSFKVK